MRHLLKFMHTVGAIGLTGAMAALFVMLRFAPSPASSLTGYAFVRGAMGAVATWIFLPSLGLTLVAGLFAMALSQGYQNAGWAWVKLATGLLVFEAGFTGVQGPMQAEAARSASALSGQVDPASLAGSTWQEQATLVLLLAIAAANVALGIWRPRLSRARG